LGRRKKQFEGSLEGRQVGIPWGPGRKYLEQFFVEGLSTPVHSRGLLAVRDGKKDLRAYLS